MGNKVVKSDPIIVGIDHGYGFIKTETMIMKSGVKEIPVKSAFSHQILEYGDSCYVVGQVRNNHRANKTETQDYYILTLAAIADELKKRGRKKADIVIAAGLPFSFFGTQKDDFKWYLLRNKNEEIEFTYEDISYQIVIEDVQLFPQGFPIIAKELASLTGRTVLVDIGSRTIDILTFDGSQALHEGCFSMNGGVINCIESIQKAFMTKYQRQLDENLLQDFFQKKRVDLPIEELSFIEKLVRYYVKNTIFSEMEAKGVDLTYGKIVFCGGGATVVQEFGDLVKNMRVINDINANAKGYVYLCKGLRAGGN